MVDKRTTGLSLVFVLVGMMFLVPVITGEALGKTEATVRSALWPSFVEKRLDEGVWVKEPLCQSSTCSWTTAGSGVIGGPEAGHVIIDYYDSGSHHHLVAKVVFRWYNPRSGTNTCEAVVLEKTRIGNPVASCHITQGNSATATYDVVY